MLTKNAFTIFLLIIVFVPLLLYVYYTRNRNYWKKKGIPYLKPKAFFGNMFDVITVRKSIGECCHSIYEKTKEPYVGMFVFDQPFLLIRDPDLIKSILISDFQYFVNRSTSTNTKGDPVGSHILFLLKKNDWRPLRKKISPVFSSGKLKLMYKLITECSEDFVGYLKDNIFQQKVIDVRETCAKYATDAITSTAFGLNANCFKEEDAPFRVVSRRVFNWKSFKTGFQITCYFIAPNLVKLFNMKFVDALSGNFLKEVFEKTMKERKKFNVVRNDLLDILNEIIASQNIDDDCYLDENKLYAQAMQFFLAGFETTSTTLTFVLYELAKNQNIQKILREEIISVKNKYGNFSYDALKEMNYLEMCVKETLRKYPVLPFLDRRCTKNYRIPNTDHIIEEGTGIYISSMGIHHDPVYFPDPQKFNPLRFSEENKTNIYPYTYLPFGDGPRNCIGARFGILTSKSGLAHVLSEYKVEICEETVKEIKFSPNAFLLAPEKDIRLKFEKLIL